MKYNRKTYTTFSDHIGKIPLVIVTPSDQNLIVGGSELRRKFVDGIISQTDNAYLQNLLRYGKALEQRNKLLKQFYENKFFEEENLSVWDEQIVAYGVPVMQSRMKFMEEFRPLFARYYELIHVGASTTEMPDIDYCSLINDVDNADPDHFFRQRLQAARQRDAFMQYTTEGPHKDDFNLRIGEFPVRRFGSQGQQKTFLLALKLAQFEYMHSHLGTKPILLLDDVFDKLDMLRVKQLVLLVGSDRFGQVFITDTQQGRVESIFSQAHDMPHKVFSVADGKLTDVNADNASGIHSSETTEDKGVDR